MGMSFFEAAAALEKRGDPFVVVTFVDGKGHLPQERGAKAIVTSAGLHSGTVGGGLVEARAVGQAQAILREGRAGPVSVTWNLQRDLAMTCGGEMSFLLEPCYPRAWNIVVYGAGHVGQALARLLATLNCRLTVIDARPEWRAKLPPGIVVHDWAKPEEHLAELPGLAYHVVVTQDHETDRPILAALCGRGAPYVGVIGSKAKAAKLRAELRALGCAEAFLESLHCPIGLELGGNEPAEIAVSIAAQLLQSRGNP